MCYHPGVVDEIAHGTVVDLLGSKGPPMCWWMGWCPDVLLCLATVGYADDRPGAPFPADEHWGGLSHLDA
jgi:hypothetical protein